MLILQRMAVKEHHLTRTIVIFRISLLFLCCFFFYNISFVFIFKLFWQAFNMSLIFNVWLSLNELWSLSGKDLCSYKHVVVFNEYNWFRSEVIFPALRITPNIYIPSFLKANLYLRSNVLKATFYCHEG